MGEMFSGAIVFNGNIGTWNTANVTTMNGMFLGAIAFNQNLGMWNISAVVDMNRMLDNSGLSVINYDGTLIGWAAQTKSNLFLGTSNLRYCTGTAARATLTSATRNWVIRGDISITAIIDFTPATLPNSVINTSYSTTINQVGFRSTDVLTWSITAGALPSGLAIVPSTGVISGISTIIGIFNFTVQVTNGSCPQTKAYSIVVEVATNPTTSINNVLSNEVKVSPNPSLGVFNVDFGALNVSKSVARVYNVQGATVHTSKVSNNMSISLENLPAGLYFLEVSTEKGSILKKLVKE